MERHLAAILAVDVVWVSASANGGILAVTQQHPTPARAITHADRHDAPRLVGEPAGRKRTRVGRLLRLPLHVERTRRRCHA